MKQKRWGDEERPCRVVSQRAVEADRNFPLLLAFRRSVFPGVADRYSPQARNPALLWGLVHRKARPSSKAQAP
jgi:hypothetical protein